MACSAEQAGTIIDPPGGRKLAWRAAAVLLLTYAAWLVSLQSWRMSRGHWAYAWFEGLWLAVVYAAVCVGLWARNDRARRMATVLAALPAAVIPLVVLASGVPHPLRAFRYHLLMAVVCAASFALLCRATPHRADGRRGVPAALTAFGINVVMFAVAGVLGFEPFETLLELTQFPGARLLTAMGYCCGISPDLVITDFDTGPWGAITQAGIPILAVANTAGLIPFVLLARRIRRRRSATPAVVVDEVAA